MGKINHDQSRNLLLDFLTRDHLNDHQVRIAQHCLKEMNNLNGRPNGKFGPETTAGMVVFLGKPENQYLIPRINDQVKEAIQQHAPDTYKQWYGPGTKFTKIEILGRGVSSYLSQNENFTSEQIGDYQKALGVAGVDNSFGRGTAKKTYEYLASHQSDFAHISPHVINLLVNTDAPGLRNVALKSPAYYARVMELDRESKSLSGSNAATYTLQSMLAASGFLTPAQEDGSRGPSLEKALDKFKDAMDDAKKHGIRIDNKLTNEWEKTNSALPEITENSIAPTVSAKRPAPF